MPSRAYAFPTLGSGAHERATLLAIDDHSLPLKRNLCYYLTRPKVRAEPVLVPSREHPDTPDYAAAHFYGTVMPDGGKYRMWYYACHPAAGDITDLREGPMCYAESDDGVQWVKPNLGLVEFKGRRDNNIVDVPDLHTEGNFVIRDDADPDPARRYKVLYNYRPPNRTWTIRTATSPDGLRWTAGPEAPFHTFIEHACLYKHNGLYFASGQMFQKSEGGHDQGRQSYVVVSPDFEHWVQESAEGFMLPEPPDPAQRGYNKPYDQAHIGIGAASFGNVVVGMYCIWHNREVFEEISGDLGLLVTNDGIHFREPVKGHIWLSTADSPVTPGPGAVWPTVLCQTNSIFNVGDETRIYHGRWRNTPYGSEYWGEVALATLPRDRWGALGLWSDQAEGAVWSCPVTLPADGPQVILNADCASDMTVEIADERFEMLAAYSGTSAGTCRDEGGLDSPVTWPTDLANLAGETVRVKINLRRASGSEPRLYAVYLV